MSATIIRNGRIIDPAKKRDEVADLYITDGKIVTSKSEIRSPKSEIEDIDARGLIVTPGLIDMHVHLREPQLPADLRLLFACQIPHLFQTIRARLHGSKIGPLRLRA